MKRKPRPLKPGGAIGVCAPSSAVDPDLIQAGCAILEARGYRIVKSPHLYDRYGHQAGRAEDRARDFVQLYSDPAVDVVWCARGGSSSCLLWPHIDWDLLARFPPKFVIGYSDVTSLHCALDRRVNVVSLHGSVIFELSIRVSEALLDWQLGLLSSPEPAGIVPGRATRTIVGGTAEGELAGGCLSLFVNTIGTRYQPDLAGKLLLIEDINHRPWAVERDLLQLREAGMLDKIAGFVVGQATDSDDSRTVPLPEIWRAMLEPLNVPTVTGFPFGHVPVNYALPLGVRARLDGDAGTLELLEAAAGV